MHAVVWNGLQSMNIHIPETALCRRNSSSALWKSHSNRWKTKTKTVFRNKSRCNPWECVRVVTPLPSGVNMCDNQTEIQS